jgi:tRNA uridine 5-carboxymethylaminomethyl modification enzyme
VDEAQWSLFSVKREKLQATLEALHSIRIRPDASTRETLESIGASVPGKAVELAALLRQPQMDIERLAVFHPALADLEQDVLREAEVQVRYEGYLVKQEELVVKFQSLEGRLLPEDLDYASVSGLTREVVEKLSRIQPRTLGQAGRISGVTPAALSCLEIHLKKLGLS